MAIARMPLLALLAGASLACATVRVTVDYDPNEDFSSYRTFAWFPIVRPSSDPEVASPLVDARIRAAVARELEAKGYRQVIDRTPDFYVTWHVSVEDKLDVYTVDRGYVGSWGYVVSIPETRVRQYEEGTLLIDVADAREKQLVWRGVGKGRLRRQPTPEQLTADVDGAVAEILERFPPEPRS